VFRFEKPGTKVVKSSNPNHISLNLVTNGPNMPLIVPPTVAPNNQYIINTAGNHHIINGDLASGSLRLTSSRCPTGQSSNYRSRHYGGRKANTVKYSIARPPPCSEVSVNIWWINQNMNHTDVLIIWKIDAPVDDLLKLQLNKWTDRVSRMTF